MRLFTVLFAGHGPQKPCQHAEGERGHYAYAWPRNFDAPLYHAVRQNAGRPHDPVQLLHRLMRIEVLDWRIRGSPEYVQPLRTERRQSSTLSAPLRETKPQARTNSFGLLVLERAFMLFVRIPAVAFLTIVVAEADSVVVVSFFIFVRAVPELVVFARIIFAVHCSVFPLAASRASRA